LKIRRKDKHHVQSPTHSQEHNDARGYKRIRAAAEDNSVFREKGMQETIALG